MAPDGAPTQAGGRCAHRGAHHVGRGGGGPGEHAIEEHTQTPAQMTPQWASLTSGAVGLSTATLRSRGRRTGRQRSRCTGSKAGSCGCCEHVPVLCAAEFHHQQQQTTGLSLRGKKKGGSERQQKRTLTGTLSASWSRHTQDTTPQKHCRTMVGGWRRLAVGGGWRLVVGGGWRLMAVNG